MCLVFFGPFSFPNSPFNSQLHPFRTLKAQWWHMSSAAGVGSRSASHTHYRLFEFRAKTEQDARPFLFWRFGGSANDRSVQLEPQICLKPIQDPGHFFDLGAWAVVSATACVQLGPEMLGTQHMTLANFWGVFFGLFWFQSAPFRARSQSTSRPKGCILFTWLKACAPLRVHNECVSIFSA